MPPLWGDLPLQGEVPSVAEFVRASSSRPFDVEPEMVVLARKRSRGARPLSRLGLKERVLYRGLTNLVSDRTTIPSRTDDAYQQFESAPLAVDGVAYVLKTDVAAYYEYIDHDRLMDEVIAQTADDLAINAIVALLRESSGRAFGLPQMTEPSDQLAELYIEPMRRQLVRAGYRVSRFADDFRVSCLTYFEALSAWDEADESARSLGLVLSETKTRIVGITKYSESVQGPSVDDINAPSSFSAWDLFDLNDYIEDELRVWSSPATGAELDEVDHQELDFQSGEPPSEAAQALASTYLDELVTTRRGDDHHSSAEGQPESIARLNRAMRILVSARNPVGLRLLPALLVYEPVATPYIAAYLRACAEDDRSEVTRTLGQISRSGITGPWQSLWMAFVAGDIERGTTRKASHHINWLRELTSSRHPAVAAEATLALARRGFMTPDGVAEVLRRLPKVHRSTAVLAMAALGDEARANATAEDHLDHIRIRWGLEELA